MNAAGNRWGVRWAGLAPLSNATWRHGRVWLFSLLILVLLWGVDPLQGGVSASAVLSSLVLTAPYVLLSIALAAYAAATGADHLVARAFSGAPARMILLASLAGALSPFCSCGVIPLIAALLAMGVPFSAVMAFWLASPIMDPSMFALTTGVLGLEFALAKTVAALSIGVWGGAVTHAIAKRGGLADPLRPGVGNGGCGGAKVRAVKPVEWLFWNDSKRIQTFGQEALKTSHFLAKWLTLAFLLESLMLAYVPASWVSTALGGSGISTIAVATVVGVPAYLNGYAALPLVSALLDQGMAPGAGMAFLIAGSVTSLPAALAVFALVKRPVFALYLALSLGGAFLTGLAFHFWMLW